MMLGLGYIMIELTLMQRFTTFLGHPAYSLTVCLFTMLLASGLGAMYSHSIFISGGKSGSEKKLVVTNGLIFLTLIVTLPAGLFVIDCFSGGSTALRIVITSLIFAPAGFLMGMPFPLAIRIASRDRNPPLSWYWDTASA